MKENLRSKKQTKKQTPLPNLTEARELLDIVYLINAILQSSGNLSRAAENLGIGRRTLYDLMEKYKISCSDGNLSIQIKPILSFLEVQAPCLEDYLTQNKEETFKH
jgi:hypothetical protein